MVSSQVVRHQEGAELTGVRRPIYFGIASRRSARRISRQWWLRTKIERLRGASPVPEVKGRQVILSESDSDAPPGSLETAKLGAKRRSVGPEAEAG